jgi:nitrogen-specific signal transduction histidine kinase
MSEPISAILDQFDLSRAFSLPELLLKGLELEGEASQQQDVLAFQKLLDLLKHSPILLLQSLMALKQEFPKANLTILEQESARKIIFEQVRSATTQYNPLLQSQTHDNFSLLCWRHAVLCSKYSSALADSCKLPCSINLETTALLINFGELIMASVYNKDYFILHAKTSSETELSRLEQQTFGVTHAELGASFIERHKLSSIDSDAIRFHHRSFEDIEDSTSDVKLCWLANQLASKEDIDFDLVNAGQKLFSLEQETLRTIKKTTTENLQSYMDVLKIDLATNKRLPLPEKMGVSNRAGNKAALLNKAQGVNNITKILHTANKSQQPLFIDVLKILSAKFFEGGQALVFTADIDEHNLLISHSTLPEEAKPEISLKLSDRPSAVAASYQANEARVIGMAYKHIKVADLQILKALGKSALLCDPVVYKSKVVALLVFGVNESGGAAYLQETPLRNTLHQLYIEQEVQASHSAINNQEFYYQQKIREAVHEANNPLGIIKNYLKILSLKQEKDSELNEELKVIETEIERVRQILNKLGNNSESEDKENPLDLNKIITGINKVFSGSIPDEQDIKIELDLDPNLPFILGKENSLKQILINLLKNAVEACVDNGLIKIETRNNFNMNQINYVMINIIDNGPGITEDIMQNLFKLDGHSGSGLAVVKNFMDELGGLISCQSDQRGTIFTLLLPRSEGSPLSKSNSDVDIISSNNSASKVYDFKR